MAIYHEDWSGSTIGQEPTGWTKRWNQTGAAWEVVDYPASPNGRALKVTRASSARAALTHNAASTEVKGRIEMRALVQLAPSYINDTPATTLFVTRASGAAGSETGYVIGLAHDHPAISVRSNIYNNGALTILGYAGDNAGLALGDRCWLILIDDGSGGFQSSAYAEADTDLSTPLAVHTFTNTTLSADGWLGLFGFTGIASGAEYWEDVVFATNGDTLPAIGAPDPVITLISDQDSMNINASSLVIENAETDTPTIKLTVRKTATTAYGDQPTWIHWYFGLSGVQGKRPIVEVEITDRWFSDDSYDPSWRPVISQDDHGTWDQFGSFIPLTTPARVRFQPAVALTADTVYLADHPPYRIAEFDALAATLAADVSGLVSPSAAATASGVIGTSPAEVDENARAIGGHEIYGFVLGDSRATTDGNPKRWMIVDTAIHPGEVIDGWPLEGLVDFYLNGTGTLADQLRSNWKIGAYFALTPNGRFGGHWRSNFERQKDANRDWGDAGAFSLAESVIVRDAILADLDSAIPEVNLSLHTASSRNKTENIYRNTAIADQTKQNAWLDALDEKDAITWDRVDTNITSSLTGWHVARGTPIGVISEFGTRTASTVARYKQIGQRLLEATAQIDADGVFYSTPVVGMTVDSTLAPNQITLRMVYAAHSGFTDLSVSGNIVTIRPGVEVLSQASDIAPDQYFNDFSIETVGVLPPWLEFKYGMPPGNDWKVAVLGDLPPWGDRWLLFDGNGGNYVDALYKITTLEGSDSDRCSACVASFWDGNSIAELVLRGSGDTFETSRGYFFRFRQGSFGSYIAKKDGNSETILAEFTLPSGASIGEASVIQNGDSVDIGFYTEGANDPTNTRYVSAVDNDPLPIGYFGIGIANNLSRECRFAYIGLGRNGEAAPRTI